MFGPLQNLQFLKLTESSCEAYDSDGECQVSARYGIIINIHKHQEIRLHNNNDGTVACQSRRSSASPILVAGLSDTSMGSKIENILV
jgi:hypothetical protein